MQPKRHIFQHFLLSLDRLKSATDKGSTPWLSFFLLLLMKVYSKPVTGAKHTVYP